MATYPAQTTLDCGIVDDVVAFLSAIAAAKYARSYNWSNIRGIPFNGTASVSDLPKSPAMHLFASLVLSSLGAGAQAIPNSWRIPNITTSVADRVSLASAALGVAIDNLDATSAQYDGEAIGVTAALYAEMAEFDIATSQTKYEAALEKYFPLIETGQANFSNRADFGRAAARAYTAYKNPTFLDYAVQSWWFGQGYTISQADASAGTIATKDFPLSEVCQDITMAGGTFWVMDNSQPDIVMLGTGSFLILSALLAEATSNSMYLQAALESSDFVQAHLYNVQHIVQDSISARANDSCAVNSLSEPYDSGLMIHGLAILANITQNATTQNL
ncbi:hypothetical protein DFH07DRAFT_951577 [Mycena maculata]|uniref:Glycoside hydrolase family 76 protein n=1 Tax=Mycena maculata TaxID=230809 RepID=A0AAD7NVR6_9AGAR|nr:hypothetical protein DFH07DRAFT_951577 [Mycena maculata]